MPRWLKVNIIGMVNARIQLRDPKNSGCDKYIGSLSIIFMYPFILGPRVIYVKAATSRVILLNSEVRKTIYSD